MENYFLNYRKVCVPGGECGENTYPEIESRTCELCNEACIGCFGPENTDCRACADKYLLNSKLVCEEIVCQGDEYLEEMTFICKSKWVVFNIIYYIIIYYIYIYIFILHNDYLECHSRCAGCTGPSYYECKGCSPGYIMNNTALQCQTCEEYDIVYLNPPPGIIDCLGMYSARLYSYIYIYIYIEVCGDQKNMGILECDDGNIISGDGCSADCSVEENFQCNGGSYNTPDICRESVPPLMVSFFQISHKQIEIQFTELVHFKGNPVIYIYIYIM